MTNNQDTIARIQMAEFASGDIKPSPAEVEELARRLLAADAELQERRKAAGEPELKPANLINKFYERYPVASFKSDTERAAALGYFMAGAELQCFGEFVKYEDLCGDE